MDEYVFIRMAIFSAPIYVFLAEGINSRVRNKFPRRIIRYPIFLLLAIVIGWIEEAFLAWLLEEKWEWV
ncbi:MAG: hypothetical protein K2I38_02340 [Duncaniella sp.]|nr:hypothetical protein [Duncaniella sp.]